MIRDKTGCKAGSSRVTRDKRVLKAAKELAISAIFPDGAGAELLCAATSVHRVVKMIDSDTFIVDPCRFTALN